MTKLKVIELFGGIGACSKALKNLRIDYEIVDYVEIDKYAVKSFNAIFDTNFEPQDITKWDKNVEADLIMHGSPCQDFSLAGQQAGGDIGSGTRSSLMYETIRIVGKLRPKYVIWENVKNLLSKKHRHNFDAYLQTMEALGYHNYYQVLNAKDYGIPQNRERVYTISIRNDIKQNFEFPPKKELKLKLKDMLEEEVDEKYYLSDKMINYISATGTANFKNPDCKINLDIARPLTTDQNKRAGTTNYLCNELPDNYDLKIKNATKKGYLEAKEGDGIDISSRMQYHRGTVQKDSIQTITTSGGNDRGVIVDKKIKPSVAINFEREKNEIATTNKEIYQCNCSSGWQDNKVGIKVSPTLRANNNNTFGLTTNLKIRKLTPKECWRLMGFADEDFEKASKVNSNTQLYKQAGNSIVVNVLVEIFKNLLL